MVARFRLFAGNAAVAVSTCVMSFASFAAVPAVVVTASVVVVSSAVYDPVFGAVSSVSTAAVVTTLGGSVDKVASLAFGVVCAQCHHYGVDSHYIHIKVRRVLTLFLLVALFALSWTWHAEYGNRGRQRETSRLVLGSGFCIAGRLGD